MKRALTALLLTVAAVTPLAAQPTCPGPSPRVTGSLNSPHDYTLSWEPFQGKVVYSVEETRSGDAQDTVTTNMFSTPEPSFTVQHESIHDVTFKYRIRVISQATHCFMYAEVKTLGDPVLRRAVRRGIVPVVGSTRGANGALFKTYLRLDGANLRGRVYFHAAGRPASDSDPSLPYDLTQESKIVWDDIVGALGQSGIGSLSIVPDEGIGAELPRATVRLYNVTDNGIFGTTAEMYPAIDFLDDTPFQRITVPADGNFRVNVGARAILDGTARAVIVGADGSQKGTADRTFRAGEMIMGSPEAVYGTALEPGGILLVSFSRAIIPFYTLTDNRTNDPFLYVQGAAERDSSVEEYVK